MYNPTQPMMGVNRPAIHYHVNKDTGDVEEGTKFLYRTYDDSQHRKTKTQRQGGTAFGKSSISIETSDTLNFDQGDIVELLTDNEKMIITQTETVQNTANSLLATVSPSATQDYLTRLHLNKDDV